ncbi:MAG TPA: rod-binding protein [Acidobacteriota bacterium]|nr:rod-binding protein [Acidobacteriota bacterium]
MNPIGPVPPVSDAPRPRPLNGADASGPDAQKAELTRLRRATADFEGIFIAHMLKTMQGTIPKNEEGLFTGGDVLRDVGWEKVAESMAHRGGLGLADMLFQSLKDKVSADPAATDSSAESGPILLHQPDRSRNLGPEPAGPRPLHDTAATQDVGLPLDGGRPVSDMGNEGS